MSVERHGAAVRLTQNVMHSLVAVLIQLEKCEFKILLGHTYSDYIWRMEWHSYRFQPSQKGTFMKFYFLRNPIFDFTHKKKKNINQFCPVSARSKWSSFTTIHDQQGSSNRVESKLLLLFFITTGLGALYRKKKEAILWNCLEFFFAGTLRMVSQELILLMCQVCAASETSVPQNYLDRKQLNYYPVQIATEVKNNVSGWVLNRLQELGRQRLVDGWRLTAAVTCHSRLLQYQQRHAHGALLEDGCLPATVQSQNNSFHYPAFLHRTSFSTSSRHAGFNVSSWDII